MLKAQNRLTSDFEYYVVKKYGTSYEGKYFYINYVVPQSYIGPTKVGFIISNKFDKRATARNRLKRVFREVVQNNFSRINENYWIVINPKFSSANKNYEEINTDFIKALQTVHFAR
jgi:ribonuclease P protein component